MKGCHGLTGRCGRRRPGWGRAATPDHLQRHTPGPGLLRRERIMDLSRSQLMKATPVGLIAGGTGGLPRVNSPFEPLAGLTVPTRPVLILTQQLTPTAHDPFARRPPGR